MKQLKKWGGEPKFNEGIRRYLVESDSKKIRSFGANDPLKKGKNCEFVDNIVQNDHQGGGGMEVKSRGNSFTI